MNLIIEVRKLFTEYNKLEELLKDYRIGVLSIKYNKNVKDIKKIITDIWYNEY